MRSSLTGGRAFRPAHLRHAFGLVGFLAAVAVTNGQVTTRVSVNSLGVPIRGGSIHVDISSDGRFVAFSGSDPWLDVTPPPSGIAVGAFVHDRWTGVTEQVVSLTGTPPGMAAVDSVSMSADGRYVCFETFASFVVPGDTNQDWDVFVHDRQTVTTVRASVTATGGQADGDAARISPCGRFVLFRAHSSHLVPGDTNGQPDLFLKDLVTGAVERINVSSSGEQAFYPVGPGVTEFWLHEASEGGRFVVFSSWASNLAPGADVNIRDVFLRDRLTGITTLLTTDAQGNPANGESSQPSISADGRFAAFASGASNLVPGDTNGTADVFVRDLRSGTLERVSVGAGGVQGDAASWWPAISPDGSKVLFTTYAASFFPPHPTNPYAVKLAVYDRLNGRLELAGVNTAGDISNGWFGFHRLSVDGTILAFSSMGNNLVAGDPYYSLDAFVRDTDLRCPPMSTYCGRKLNSADCRPTISTSGIPTLTGYDTFFVTAIDVLNNKNGFYFWSLTSQNVPFLGGRLCVQAPVVRTAVRDSLGNPPSAGTDCSGFFSFPFDQSYMNARGLSAGTTIYGQFWYRDPGFPAPNNVGLTNGIEFTICN